MLGNNMLGNTMLGNTMLGNKVLGLRLGLEIGQNDAMLQMSKMCCPESAHR